MKLDIDDLRFMLELDRHGSLAALARAENITPPAITKRLNQLEARLGLRLALRTTRRLQLTHEGHLLAQHATGVLGQMQAIEEALQARSQVVAGKLKVHGPLGFGRRHLAPLMAQFRERHPNVQAQLYLSDNLMLPQLPVHGRDAFDLLISIGEIPDSRWVSHRIAPNRRILCAAPAYLKRAGQPAKPADLADHDCLVLRENDEDVTLWRFHGAAGRSAPQTVRVQAAMESNDGEVIHQWCLAGKGVMIRSEWDVHDSLADGRLVELLPRHRPAQADIMALVPQSKVASARTRHFIALLKAAFQPHPPWRPAH